MAAIHDILRAGVAVQSTALLGKNVKLAMKKKIRTKDMLKTGMTNIIGIPLLQTQSQLIGQIP
ncbi:MAG TPA: hypothetical protein VGA29_07600 [Ignavibacteriaceae bacterium]